MSRCMPPRLRREGGRLEVLLPLAAPTSKIRLKRFVKDKFIGEPVSARSRPISAEDYLEWQISYFRSPSDKCVEPSLELPNVSFRNSKGHETVAYELPKIIYDAVVLGIIEKTEIESLADFAKSLSPNDTIEENFAPERSRLKGALKGGFIPYIEKTYAFVKRDTPEHWVEIVLKHKQRAVGFQSMVYLCISVTQLLSDVDGENVVGRPAHPKEYAYLVVNKDNARAFLDAVRAFSLASAQHRGDILKILSEIQKLL